VTQHVDAIAERVLRELRQEPRLARRLLIPQLRWLAADPDEADAEQWGVLEAVDRARDEHLATLGTDDGLAALGVGWEEVVRRAAELAEPRRSVRCPRCGARLPLRRPVCSRCRLPRPPS
jgi:hypothetical protein